MGNIKKVFQEQLDLIKPPEEVEEKIREVAEEFIEELREKLSLKKIKADIFIGGSVAKGTVIKKDVYDMDVFVRFEGYSDSEISGLLGRVMNHFIKKGMVKKVHGSRDYYQLIIDGILIEVIPVLKIKKPADALNVTDLSYFHVSYVLKKLNKKLVDDIRLAKTFVYAQGVYGAESYIHGFSGYALELLVLHFGGFEKFIKEVAKMEVSKRSKAVIDDAGFYSGKDRVLSQMNASKIVGPLVLVDPTFKERNALSGLSLESFVKFQKACQKFLKNPSGRFFKVADVGLQFEKYKDAKMVSVRTNKQAGDIAGTKSRKFFDFFVYKLAREFKVKKAEFDYDDSKNVAKFYFVLDIKKDEIVRGPPVTSVHHLTGFKNAHPSAFVEKGFAYARLKHKISFEKWFNDFLKKEKKVMKEMGIVEMS